MKFLIASFKSRNNLLNFNSRLKQNNIYTDIINTPKLISKSCGLSVKFDFIYLNLSINILKTFNLYDFMGLYLIERLGFNERIQRLY